MHLLQSIKIVIIFSVLAIISACSGYENNQLSDQPISELIHSQIQIESQWSRDGAYYVSPSLSADLPQFRVGLMLTLIEGTPKSAPIPVWARGINEQGEQTRWHEASWTWIEDPQRVGLVDFNSGMTAGQIRIHEEDVNSIQAVTWSLVTPLRRASTDRIDGISGTQVSVKQQALDSYFATNGVISREEWGARDSDGCGIDTVARYRMAVHHTAGHASTNGDYASKIRSTQAYHMDTRGWCDIGYHFLVTYDGSTWEGRPAEYRGAHVGDHNSGNIGVSFVGCYHNDDYCQPLPPNQPSDIMITNGGALLGLISDHYGIIVDNENVIGHRDHTGASTSCPGDYLYEELDNMRAIANGTSPVDDDDDDNDNDNNDPGTGNVLGVVWDLSIADDASDSDEARITTATVTCSCGESTGVASSNALWSFDLPVGTYTFTASATGYQDAQAVVTVLEGQDVWNSFGLMPTDDDTDSDDMVDAGVDNTDLGPGEDSGNNNDGSNEEDDDSSANNDSGIVDGITDNSDLTDGDANNTAGVGGLNGETDLTLVPAQSEADEGGCSCTSQRQSSSEPMMAGFLLGLVFIQRRKR